MNGFFALRKVARLSHSTQSWPVRGNGLSRGVPSDQIPLIRDFLIGLGMGAHHKGKLVQKWISGSNLRQPCLCRFLPPFLILWHEEQAHRAVPYLDVLSNNWSFPAFLFLSPFSPGATTHELHVPQDCGQGWRFSSSDDQTFHFFLRFPCVAFAMQDVGG